MKQAHRPLGAERRAHTDCKSCGSWVQSAPAGAPSEDRAQDGDLLGRLELEPDARGGQRIDRPALELVGGQDGGIAEGGH